MRIIFLLTVMAWGNLLHAQQREVDALKDSLESTTSIERQVDILNAIAEKSLKYDLDYSLSSAQRAKELGLEIGYLSGIAKANRWLGNGNYSKRKSFKAIKYLMEALVVFKDLTDSLQMADVYKCLANVYSDNGNEREAMRYYGVAMAIYNNLGEVSGKSSVLNNIGTIYLEKEVPDSALYFLNQAMLSNLEIKEEWGLATNYSNMGFAYALKDDYRKAIEYYNKGYELAIKVDSKETMATALINIGDGYMNLAEYELAKEKVQEGLALAEEDGYMYITYIGCYTMGEINEREGKYEESLAWYHKSERINEELNNSATSIALMDVQTTQLREAQENEINRLNATNEEKVESGRLKNLLYLAVAVFSLIVLLGLSYYYSKRHKVALKIAIQNKEISNQKEQIEAQSEKLVQINNVLLDRNSRLRKLNEEKNYMMSVVAHDLKSPLNQINGLTNVIKLDEQNLNSSQKECFDNIAVASNRLSEMVGKILDSRGFDRKQDNVHFETINIEKMAIDVLNDFSTMANHKSIKLHHNVLNDQTSVKADRHYLRQVLDNLVSNAIKFSPSGKKVELNIKTTDAKIIAEVVDEGPGISEEDQKYLYSEYSTLSAKPTGGETSTGLGLAIVKNYIEKMGGDIICESKVGHGATFSVFLDRS